MPYFSMTPAARIARDLTAGSVVSFVAVPLCLGVALASGAPLFSGLITGIVAGILVGALSGSPTSVSGPAAGLTAVVAAQIGALGSFEAFLLAVVLAGFLQIGLGLAKAGFIAAFFPSSVIKGLLAAIGTILVLKQIPHLFGHDADPEGDMSFFQPDHETTISELGRVLENLHPGASLIGLGCLAVLVVWDLVPALKRSVVPAPLVVVVLGTIAAALVGGLGGNWGIGAQHLVQIPVASSAGGIMDFLTTPDWSSWSNPAVYKSAVTVAVVASLKTLLNLEAVDELDRYRRHSPPNRELVAQGVGNVVVGLLGGLPMTSAIVRSSVNIHAGAQTRLSTIFHGFLLLVFVVVLPTTLNRIPLSCVAAILIVTGVKLASPKLIRQLWDEGLYQFAPFIVTVVAIVLTDLLMGILIGLAVSLSFILSSNLRAPIRRVVEKHLTDEVLHVQLANQVSFFKRGALAKVLNGVPRGGHLLLDAQNTDYIDPDVLDLLQDYTRKTAPARGVEVSLIGFRDQYRLEDRIQFMDYSTREMQSGLEPGQALTILKDGYERFRSGRRLLSRNLARQVDATAKGQHPIGVVLSCIDSRVPTELIFDAGVGDIFSVRVAGNVLSRKILGSIEYACAVAGAKLVLVMGHTSCGAVTAAVDLERQGGSVAEATGCDHVEHVLEDLRKAIDPEGFRALDHASPADKQAFVNRTARENVLLTMRGIPEQSGTLARLLDAGRIIVVGAMYDVATGTIEFIENP